MDFRKDSLRTGKFERIIFSKALLSIIIIEIINFFLLAYYVKPWYILIIPIAFILVFLFLYLRYRDKKLPSFAIILSSIAVIVLLIINYTLNGGFQGSSTYTNFGGLFLILLIINPKIRLTIMSAFLGLMVVLIILETTEVIQLYSIPREGVLKYSTFLFVIFFIGYMIHSIKSFFDKERAELTQINRDLKGKQFLINNQYEALERQKHELKEINKNLDRKIASRNSDLEKQTNSIQEYLSLNSEELKMALMSYKKLISELENGSNNLDREALVNIKNRVKIFDERLKTSR